MLRGCPPGQTTKALGVPLCKDHLERSGLSRVRTVPTGFMFGPMKDGLIPMCVAAALHPHGLLRGSTHPNK